MGIIKTIKECESCAERREKIKATMAAIVDWVRNPGTVPSPMSRNIPTAQTGGGPRPKPERR